MKKQFLLILIALFTVSFASADFKDLKKAVKKKTVGEKKSAKKPAAKKNSDTVVLVKGMKITKCQKIVPATGYLTLNSIKNSVKIPIKNGVFDLVLPANPEFSDDIQPEEGQFGTAIVYSFMNTQLTLTLSANSKPSGLAEDEILNMEGLYHFSDSDVTGSVYGETVKFKKGWNIINKKHIAVQIYCASERGY